MTWAFAPRSRVGEDIDPYDSSSENPQVRAL